jgi:hypothetical protein
MLERAHGAGVPFAWVTGDSVYGAVTMNMALIPSVATPDS